MDQETIDLVAFAERHLDGAVMLSREAGWPHRREAWAMLLVLSSVWGSSFSRASSRRQSYASRQWSTSSRR